MNYETNTRVNIAELELQDGDSFIFTDFRSADAAAVAVHPAVGATVYVSLICSTTERIKAGTARLLAAGVGTLGTAPDGKPAGVVTTPDGFELGAPVTGIRFVVVGGSAAVEIVQ